MLNEIKNARLSPLLVTMLATVTALSLSQTARGETVDSASLKAETAIQEQEAPLQGSQEVSAPLSALVEDTQTPAPIAAEQIQPEVENPQTLPSQEQPANPSEQTPSSPQTTPPEEQTPTPSSPQTTPPEEQTPDSSETPPAEEPRVLVAEVLVSGANQELIDLVYNTIRTQPGRTATRSQLQEDVNAIYATGYFANVTVTPEDTPLGVRVTFAVQPNPILNQVLIQTVPPETDKRVLPPAIIDQTFQEQYGKILNLRDLQEGIKKINEWYAENGYDLAQVVGSPQVSEDGTVTLVIAEGIIENVAVRFFDAEDAPAEGKTRDFIITREMQLKPGDVFNRNTAQRDLQRVYGLGIFEDVRLSFSPGSDPREVVVNVDVVEGSTGSLAAGAGISSNSGLFGTVSYRQQNLGGNNQSIGAEFQLGEREILFNASFTDPWIGGDPYRTSYTVDVFRRRSISLVFDGDNNEIRTEDGDDRPRVVRTGGGIIFTRPLADNPFTRPDWVLSAGFQYQHVTVENSDGDTAPKSTGGENLAFSDDGVDDLFFFKFSASQDNRNNSTQPTSGSLLRLGLDQTAPIGSGNILMTRVRASYSYFIPVSLINFDFTEGPQALAFNIQAGTVLNDLPPYEAFVLGGSTSVRGYDEGEVGSGRTYIQATVEYRFPIISIFRGALFFDYGSTLGSGNTVPGNPSGVRDLPGSGYGYGIGIRVDTPVGPLRVDYAINQDGDSKIHFGIGEKF